MSVREHLESRKSPAIHSGNLRYPSDLTDEEGAVIALLIPAAKKGGNKTSVNVRTVVNGVMYILSKGCQWAALPKDLPARSTVNDDLRRWDDDRTLNHMHHTLYVQCREQVGGDPRPPPSPGGPPVASSLKAGVIGPLIVRTNGETRTVALRLLVFGQHRTGDNAAG